jgi:hypothetical protein
MKKGYGDGDAWMLGNRYNENYWGRYPLGLQYVIYEKLLAFEARAKKNLEYATIKGFNEEFNLISGFSDIVRYNISELERSMSFNESIITEQRFGLESYCLN